MWLYVSGQNEYVDKQTLNKVYYVEYRLNSGEVISFENTLTNIDDKYYWFLSDKGMSIVEKNRVVTMLTC